MAISAAARRFMRGAVSPEKFVRRNCLGGMYRLANRPGSQARRRRTTCTAGIRWRSRRARAARSTHGTTGGQSGPCKGRHGAHREKSSGIIWQDVLPSPVMTNTFPADARVEALANWLRTHEARYGLSLATLAPASADASFRRYFRLASSGGHGPTLIAVDAP